MQKPSTDPTFVKLDKFIARTNYKKHKYFSKVLSRIIDPKLTVNYHQNKPKIALGLQLVRCLFQIPR